MKIGDFHSIGRYNNYAKNSAYTRTRQKEEDGSLWTNKTKSTNKTNQTSNTATAGLSKKAKSVLDALQARYGDKMDFFVQDFNSTDEAKGIMSGSSKEYSVLFSPDELEKMANSKSYMNEKLKNIDDSMQMSSNISKSLASNSDPNAVRQSDISKIGISFDKNGTMSLFADLEKTMVNQNSQKTNQSNQSNRYGTNKTNTNKVTVKRTTVKASSMEELIEKMSNMSWADVEAEEEEATNSDWWNFDV